ncbi:MAG: hypothetical protein J6B23_00460 [Clostridia bacterium]|nr:hypothetical protein [Clostridia bacterium]
MSKNRFAVPLAQLGMRQVDLLYEIQKRGYPRLNQQQLSAYARGATVGPQADAVLKLGDMIIDEWAKKNGEKRMAQ